MTLDEETRLELSAEVSRKLLRNAAKAVGNEYSTAYADDNPQLVIAVMEIAERSFNDRV